MSSITHSPDEVTQSAQSIASASSALNSTVGSRQRVVMALNHQEADRIPLDLGGCGQTGMHVTTVYKLRQALHLDPPGTPVKVIEPYQMLGEIAPDLQETLGVDVAGLGTPGTLFGFKSEDWKAWEFWDGTPLLVPGKFNTEPDENGDILMYVDGDKAVPPCAKMPKGGFYFDSIVRQEPIVDEALDPRDNVEDFGPISDEDLAYLEHESCRLYEETDKALMLGLGGAGFGDIALVPGPWMKHPKGIRDVAEWYMSTVTRKEYVRQVFDMQCEIVMANLPRIYRAVADRATVVWVSGTDFGSQNSCFISPRAFRDLYKPFYRRVNDWIHQHTPWKTFIHTCGSIQPLIPDIVEAGFDILNPVQTSAANMQPADLKARFGHQVTFWGGGVDTQQTISFGTPQEVYDEVRQRIDIFNENGGFVFNSIHNIQGPTPTENMLALFRAVRDSANDGLGK